MSLCIRTISTKFPTTVGTRIPVTQFDQRLQNVQQSKLHALSFSSINYPQSICKTSVPWGLNNFPKYSEDKFTFHQNSKYSKDVCYTEDLISKQVSADLKGFSNNYSLEQRNGYRILNSNQIDTKLFPAQGNLGLKQKTPDYQRGPIFDASESPKTEGIDPREGRPSIRQIEKIKNNLSTNLPLFFVTMMDYHIYTPDLVFVNNIRGSTTKGFVWYYLQSTLLKFYGHVKFIYIKLHVLKITANPEDDSVKVRWRITGIGGSKIITRLFKFGNPFQIRETIAKEEEAWYDGFSTFYINQNGKVYKHVVDKMMPDSNLEEVKKDIKIPLKLALCLGLSNVDLYSTLSTSLSSSA